MEGINVQMVQGFFEACILQLLSVEEKNGISIDLFQQQKSLQKKALPCTHNSFPMYTELL